MSDNYNESGNMSVTELKELLNWIRDENARVAFAIGSLTLISRDEDRDTGDNLPLI